MPKQSNLHCRNGIYYIRVRVPKDLVPLLGKKEIKRSLKTSNKADAKALLGIEMLKVQQLFSKTLKQNTPVKPTQSAPRLSKMEIERAVLIWHQSEIDVTERRTDALRVSASCESIEDAKQTSREILASIASESDYEYMPFVYPAIESAFSAAGLELPKDDESRLYAVNLIQQSLIEQSYNELERLGENTDRIPFSFFSKTNLIPHQQRAQAQISIMLKTLCEKFNSAKSSDGVTPKSMASYRLTIDVANEVFGRDRNIETITSEDCRSYRNQLRKLPSNAKKKYPRLTLLDAAKAHTDDSTRLSISSVNRHLFNLSTIFKFAQQEGFIDKNPAAHIKQFHEKKKTARSPFSHQELATIFNAPLFTGCKDDERGYSKRGNNHPRRHRFWVPLIGLFTGMRLNEICQLLVDDIVEEAGLHLIRVEANEEMGNTLKTEQSKRDIPIHEELIRIGLLEHVTAIKKAGHKRLFPSITPSADGSYSSNFTKWFNKFLKSLKIKRDGICFHSFRHTFRDAMREANIEREIAAQLGGWKNSDSVMDNYGKGYQNASLNKALQRVSYRDLSLLHLLRSGAS